ncbi:MAG TPA: GIDE domain-containing protein [Candidatus Aquilonibacter sp.]|nr:GIDE domain-containing protein [Candidatus Aquilonibacter sp.]
MRFATFNLSIVVRQSSDSRPIAWCVIGVFVGLYIFYKGFLLLQRRHLILDTPVSKIRSASVGLVELNGLAVGPYTMLAPITERPCYYHRTVAWEWKRRGKNNQWVKVAAECMHVPFFLDDNTGKVMVDPCGAELDLHRDFEQEFCDGFFTTKPGAPPNVQNFLLRYGVSTRNKIKVEEFCIKPKNALFVLGTLDENPGLELTRQPIQEAESTGSSRNNFSLSLGLSSSSFVRGGSNGNSLGKSSFTIFPKKNTSEDDRLLAVLSKPDSDRASAAQATQVIHLSPAAARADAAEMTQQQKVAAALVKAGITNPAAWAAARVAPTPVVRRSDANGIAQSVATSPASAEATLPEGFEQRPRVVLMKGKNNSNFIISWRSQREIANSLGWKCTLMIWGGPALTVLCLYALHNMTHWF